MAWRAIATQPHPSVSIQITKHSRCSIFLQILSFSRTHSHTRSCAHTVSYLWFYLMFWLSWPFTTVHTLKTNRWHERVGRNYVLYEVWCCMFLVAKAKILFLHRIPNTFRKSLLCYSCWRYIFFSPHIHTFSLSLAHSLYIAYCCLTLCHWYFAMRCCCFEQWTWCECYVMSVVHVVCIPYYVHCTTHPTVPLCFSIVHSTHSYMSYRIFSFTLQATFQCK